jgi:prolyl oligopeptidase
MMKPPIAPIEPLTETYFDTPLVDPYRWLEESHSQESMTWTNGQAQFSRAYLDALPDRAEILAAIEQYSGARILVYNFKLGGERLFYLRRDVNDNLPRLVMRPQPGAPEQTLINPNELGGEVHTALDWYVPSPRGRKVAYGLSQGGSEQSTLHILDIETGVILPERISGTDFGLVEWLDEESFLYNRLPTNRDETNYYNFSCAYLHQLGSDPEKDPLLLGNGAHGLPVDGPDIPLIVANEASDWLIGRIMHGDLNEYSLYVTPRTALEQPEQITWRRIVSPEDGVTEFLLSGDTLFLRTHHDAPRYKVVAYNLKTNAAATLIPSSDLVIDHLALAGDYLITLDMDAGLSTMRRVHLPTGQIETVPLPLQGSILEIVTNRESSLVYFRAESWQTSPILYRYDLQSGTIIETDVIPPSTVDMSDIVAHEVLAPAADGTLIPLSIIHHRDVERNGNNPTLLSAYGSYGISIQPAFMTLMKAWYDQGGIFAIAHVRGGGEYGKEWHTAGQFLNKKNTIGDFIACAEYLVREGYTRPQLLAGEGTSAGGIPSSNAAVMRPDLWAAMVVRVGVTNIMRFELTPNGPPNVAEFGSTSTPEGFAGLQIMDSYHKVKEGVAYPAMMLTTGLNDPRVETWMATKMAARLQAATSSTRPILLRVEVQGGHGAGSTRQQVNEEWADIFAFLLDQFDK